MRKLIRGRIQNTCDGCTQSCAARPISKEIPNNCPLENVPTNPYPKGIHPVSANDYHEVWEECVGVYIEPEEYENE
jgi:hypothetical protein